jgi:hypothetical protein
MMHERQKKKKRNNGSLTRRTLGFCLYILSTVKKFNQEDSNNILKNYQTRS